MVCKVDKILKQRKKTRRLSPWIELIYLSRNRGWFLVFTLSVAVNCSITIFFAIYCINVEGWKLLYVIGLIEALIFCGLGWLLSGFTVSHFDFINA